MIVIFNVIKNNRKNEILIDFNIYLFITNPQELMQLLALTSARNHIMNVYIKFK